MEFGKNVLVDIQHDAEIAPHDTAIGGVARVHRGAAAAS